MEPIEYTTAALEGHTMERMLNRLNELGAQGWKVCASVHAQVGSDVIGRVQPGQHQVELLLLRRHRAA